jgi:replicative DNA helicase
MDVEHEVICALLEEGSTQQLHDAGISTVHFLVGRHRTALRTILDHQARYGELPSAAVLLDVLPDYEIHTPGDSLEVYLDRLRAAHRSRLLEGGLTRAVSALEAGDLDGCQQELGATVATMGEFAPRARHVDLTRTGAQRLERYRSFRDGTGLRGIPTGFPTINRATLGFQPGQLTAVGGLAKGGKSALLLHFGRHAHEQAWRDGTEFSPLIVTIEMTPEEIAERFDAWRAGLDAQDLRGGELNQAEWLRLQRALDALAAMPAFHVVKGIAQSCTISEISAHLQRHRPDMLLVDGVYLMRDELTGEVGTPPALTSLTQNFKRLADTWEIPVVITSQLLRSKLGRNGAAHAGSFGWSSSFEQDSDVVMGMEPTDDDNIKLLKILASRNCPVTSAYLRWDWSNARFEELEENPFGPDTSGGEHAPRW